LYQMKASSDQSYVRVVITAVVFLALSSLWFPFAEWKCLPAKESPTHEILYPGSPTKAN
jgi:hypothetical protein